MQNKTRNFKLVVLHKTNSIKVSKSKTRSGILIEKSQKPFFIVKTNAFDDVVVVVKPLALVDVDVLRFNVELLACCLLRRLNSVLWITLK